jgi:tripartite-type tricarboxylate transporter receptor subunit TctC
MALRSLRLGARWLAAVCWILAAGAPLARAWPERPLTVVVPFPAGGPTDVLTRALADKLSARLGQPAVVENKPGAGGALGSAAVARADADGYTLLMATNSTHAVGPALEQLSYDPRADFTPVLWVGSAPNLLVVSPQLAARSVAELIAFAKERPGALNYASSGVGTIVHLSSEDFAARAGISLTHVPYKGIQLAIPDLMSGDVSLLFESILTAQPHLKSGRLRALALAGPQRSSLLPDVPTVAESGLPGFQSATWFGVFGPAGLPAPVLERLNAELNALLGDPEILARFARLGFEPAGGSAAELASLVARDAEYWAKRIRETGVRPE